MNIDDYRKQRSDSTKNSVNNYKKPRKILHSFINRILLTIIVFLIGMIFTKNSATNKKIISENELVYGHKYDRTGYAWKLELIEKMNNNKEISGKQGIWNLNL